jgi:hypothetical protein
MKNEINNWLTGNREYNEGVALFQKYGKNPKLKQFFLTKDNDYAQEKLAYELEKIIEGLEDSKEGIDAPVENTEGLLEGEGVDAPVENTEGLLEGEGVDAPVENTEGKVMNFPQSTHTELATEAIDNTIFPKFDNQVLKNQNYPAELAEMVIERQGLTNKKGKLANTLSTFGENDNEGRKVVMDEIATIRERINEINETERHFIKHTKMPDKVDKGEKFDILTAPYPIDKAELLKWKKSLSEMRSKAKKKLEKTGETSEEGQKLAIKIGKINERYETVEKALTGGQ